MGLCAAGDGIKTDTTCEMCNQWICKSHFRSHQSNLEEFDGELALPFVNVVSMRQLRLYPVCLQCEEHEMVPPGYPKHYVNAKGKVVCIGVLIIIVVIAVAVAMN